MHLVFLHLVRGDDVAHILRRVDLKLCQKSLETIARSAFVTRESGYGVSHHPLHVFPCQAIIHLFSSNHAHHLCCNPHVKAVFATHDYTPGLHTVLLPGSHPRPTHDYLDYQSQNSRLILS